MGTLTKAERRALEWIRDREPVGSFPFDGPRLSVVKRLAAGGLLHHPTKESGVFGFVQYELTEAGRSALEAAE